VSIVIRHHFSKSMVSDPNIMQTSMHFGKKRQGGGEHRPYACRETCLLLIVPHQIAGIAY
jgi:hypothetical protein